MRAAQGLLVGFNCGAQEIERIIDENVGLACSGI